MWDGVPLVFYPEGTDDRMGMKCKAEVAREGGVVYLIIFQFWGSGRELVQESLLSDQC
jgi:hypothetical protein